MNDLLAKLANSNVELSVVDEKLKVRSKKGGLESELLALIKLNRDELIAFLTKEKGVQGNTLDIISSEMSLTDGSTAPLSYAEKRIWFEDKFYSDGVGYNMCSAFELSSELDIAKLERAITEIISSNSCLRVNYATLDGEPVRKHRDTEVFSVFLVGDLEKPSSVDDLIAQESRYKFDLANDLLLRVTYLKSDNKIINNDVLIVNIHHIVSDGWSVNLFINELVGRYNGDTNVSEGHSASTFTYEDYSYSQHQWVSTNRLAHQLKFWQEQLGGASPVHSLPLITKRDHNSPKNGGVVELTIEKQLLADLKGVSAKNSATLFMLLHAALGLVVCRFSSETDTVIGTPVSGRHYSGVESIMGCFVNMLPLRTNTDFTQWSEYLDHVKAVNKQAQLNKDLPFDYLVEMLGAKRRVGCSPIFQIMLTLDDAEPISIDFTGVDIKEVKRRFFDVKMDINVNVSFQNGKAFVCFEYNKSIFDEHFINRVANCYLGVLEQIVNLSSDGKLSEISFVDNNEYKFLTSTVNKTEKEYLNTHSVAELFEARVIQQPDTIAVELDSQTLTYGELDKYARTIESSLLACGVEQGDLVGVCMHRSVEMVASIIAILKAGCAYVPIDPAIPTARKQYIVENTQLNIILCRNISELNLRVTSCELIEVDTLESNQFNCETPTKNDINPQGAAYVIYTSGSTGNPKGVVVSHQALLNRLHWMQDEFHLASEDAVLQKTPFTFDVSVWEFLWTLCWGGRLVLAKPEGHKDPIYIRKLIAEKNVSILHFVPSMLDAYLSQANPDFGKSVRLVVCSGEALKKETVAQFYRVGRDISLFNLYGPTEAAIDVSYFNCENYRNYPTVPIGEPISNIKLYVLDEDFCLCPIGVKGELYISGVGLADGYLNNLELTNKAFLSNPFSTGLYSRMYRTGDIVRRMPCGNIEYIGRRDDQIKLHGQRIELGEIENKLATLDCIDSCVVVAKRDTGGVNVVVAYCKYKASTGTKFTSKAVTDALKKVLPDFMIPSQIVEVEEWPRTLSGKIDKKQLPDYRESLADEQVLEPENETEQKLRMLWSGLLEKDVSLLSCTADFFQIGGNSLLAVKLSVKIESLFSAYVDIRTIFENPTIRLLAKEIISKSETSTLIELLPRQGNLERYPASFFQQRMWFLNRIDSASNAYNMAAAFEVDKSLDVDALSRSLSTIIERHEVLRTVYVEEAGEVYQKVLSPFHFDVVFHEVASTLNTEQKYECIEKELAKPFSLETGPVLRVGYYKSRNGNSEGDILVFCIHHIASDGASVDIIMKEVEMLYTAETSGTEYNLPKLDIQYVDYAKWLRANIDNPRFNAQLLYWQNKLKGAPDKHSIELDMPRPLVKQSEGQMVSTKYSNIDQFDAAVKKYKVTEFMLLHAVLALVVSRNSNADDILIGTPVANRLDSKLESLIGGFVNTLPLRVDTDKRRLSDYISEIRDCNLDAQSNQMVPFELIVDKTDSNRSASYTPLVQIVLTVTGQDDGKHSTSSREFQLGSSRINMISLPDVASKFDLEIDVNIRDSEIQIDWIFDKAIFTPFRVERFAEHFLGLLDSIVKFSQGNYEEVNLSELEMLAQDEIKELLFDDNPYYADNKSNGTIHQQFEKYAHETPLASAIGFDNKRITYADLNNAANMVAQDLLACGVKTGDFVGVCLNRSIEMLVAILGTLKAGAAYVPMDPDYPEERLKFIVEDCKPVAICIDDGALSTVPSLNRRNVSLIKLDNVFDRSRTQQFDAPDINISPSSNAYLIYTSGSTGKPKGVIQSHENVTRLFATTKRYFEFTSKDVWVLFHSISFDFSVWEMWGALFNGGLLIVPDLETIRDSNKFLELCQSGGVTVINQTPSAFKALSTSLLRSTYNLPDVRFVIFGGEALEPHSVKQWKHRPGGCATQFVNMYGITETTVHASHWEVDETESASIIGKKLDDQTFYILDKDGKLSPKYAVGELFIGGSGLAKGYLNRDELTNERFISKQLNGVSLGRLYRTGDLVRYRQDGLIEYYGRCDNQVKIRGYRIELGEITNVINSLKIFPTSLVVIRDDLAGDKCIVAYLVGAYEGDANSLIEDVKSQLKASLPEYMRPSHYFLIDSIPLTANGKVDVGQLPTPYISSDDLADFEPPATQTEQKLARIWSTLLGVELECFGVKDGFFTVGGHSLKAMQLVSEVRSEFDVDIDVTTVLSNQTIRELAACIDNVSTVSNYSEMKSVASENTLFDLSEHQKRMWFVDQVQGAGSAYNIPFALHIEGEFIPEIAEQALNVILERHTALRTIFKQDDLKPVQIIQAHKNRKLNTLNLSDDNEDSARLNLTTLLSKEIDECFVLENGPLFKYSLYKLPAKHGKDQYVLLFVFHHIISDGWSLSIISKEFSEIYNQIHSGEILSWETNAWQYVDYAEWSNANVSSDVYKSQIEYWKKKLVNIPQVHNLPLDKPRPRHQTFSGNYYDFSLGIDVSDKIRILASKNNTTPFVFLNAVFFILLARFSRQTDIVIGVPTAGRTSKSLESVVGFFINTLVLRASYASEETFGGFLQKIKEVNVEAIKNQDVSFTTLLDEIDHARSRSHSPLFQILMSMDTNDVHVPKMANLDVQMFDLVSRQSKYDLVFHVAGSHSEYKMSFEYNTDIFDETTIEVLSRSLQALTNSAIENFDSPVGDLDITGEKWFHNNPPVEQLNDTRLSSCVQDLFIKSAGVYPDNIAIVDQLGSVTYKELLQASSQVWDALTKQGIGNGDIIGIQLPKGRDQVISALGILMAGAVYLPLELSWPIERCRNILKKAKAKSIIVNEYKYDGDIELELVCADILSNNQSISYQRYLSEYSTPQAVSDLAYVIFTSGSTGEPKGVEIEHRSVINTLIAINDLYGFSESDKALSVSALSFDLSVYDIFGMLCIGGCIVFPDHQRSMDPEHWVDMVETHGVTIWNTVPVSASLFIDQLEYRKGIKPVNIKAVLMSGDWIPPDLPSKIWNIIPDSSVYSLGGATEGSIWSIHYPITTDTSALKSIPYGKPLPGQQFYILNDRGVPVPKGVAGELHIGGIGVARGYCNSETLTKERYVWNAIVGARLYKTGDLGRYFTDGNIEFLGRLDHQVKLRGFRIELGEIEAQLSKHKVVETSVVMVQGEGASQKIVAYIILDSGFNKVAGESEAELKHKLTNMLTDVLPDYMLPSSYCFLDELPLTSNGKVDKSSLPEIEHGNASNNHYVSPKNDTQKQLCSFWEEILQVDRIGIHDDIYEYGANSLSVLQFAGKVRKILQKEIKLDALFLNFTVSAQSEILENSVKTGDDLFLFNHDDLVLASYAQKRLWFIDRFNGGSSEYNMPLGILLEGDVNENRIKKALGKIVERHATLRTIFPERDGKPYQKVLQEYSLAIMDTDLTASDPDEQIHIADRLLQDESQYAFNLKEEIPIRIRLLKLSRTRFVLQVNMHHIASDGWSLGVFSKEFGNFYNGDETAPETLPVSYLDYSAWQNNWLESDEFTQQLDFWKHELEGIDYENSLPSDYPRPLVPGFKGNLLTQEIDTDTLTKIHTICRQHNVTLFMFLQTVLAVLVSRFSNRQEVVIGTAVSGRQRSELEQLIGFFVNSLVLRSSIADKSFSELLADNRQTIAKAFSHQDVPFDMVVEELNPERTTAHHPIFQIMFVLQNHELGQIEIPDVTVSMQEKEHNDNKFDLHLTAEELNNKLYIDWIYDTDLYEESSITGLINSYLTIVKAIVDDVDSYVLRIPLVDVNENSHSQRESASGTSSASTNLIHGLFDDKSLQFSTRTAIAMDKHTLSYFELSARADVLAKHLVHLGIGVGDFVGINIERSFELVISIIAVLKCGAAYVPLDPEYPEQRLIFIANDADLKLILTNVDSKRLDRFKYLDLRESDDQLRKCSEMATLPTTITDDSPAYVIYTSGSTGNPKGVVVTHKNVVRLFLSADKLFNFSELDVWTLFHSYAFDFSVWEIWGALLYGAKLIIVPKCLTRSPDQFANLVIEEGVTVLNQTPSAFYPISDLLLERRDELNLAYIIFGGEALARPKLNKWFDLKGAHQTKLINMYGITETTVHVTYEQLTGDDERGGIIGRPLPDLDIMICNEQLIPQPDNVEGELLVAGPGLAQGYLNQDELTASKFIEHEFPGDSKRRWYRSGDLVKRLRDGCLSYIGRKDGQVKIRGFRIETGEIEAELQKYEGVAEAVVLAQDIDLDNKALVAYLRPDAKLLNNYNGEGDPDGVKSWQGIFDDVYSSEQEGQKPDYLNITGWECSYREGLIPEIEMQEWVENTVDRIHQLNPGSVLEIGVGTGMLLSRYAENCTSVVATDISGTALSSVSKIIDQKGWDHVTLIHGDALSLEQHLDRKFDTVIINSVVQYFPSEKYFRTMLSNLLPFITPGGKLLIGDVRNLDLLNEFSSSLSLFRASADESLETIRQTAIVHKHNEEELIFSSAYFMKVSEHLPEITGADILVKYGRWLNEMSKYRYDVILTVNGDERNKLNCWHKWSGRDEFIKVLKSANDSAIGFFGVPNQRILQDSDNADVLSSPVGGKLTDLNINNDLGVCDFFDALSQLAGTFNYALSITCGPLNPRTVDFILTKYGSEERIGIEPYEQNIIGPLVNAPQLKSLAKDIVPPLRSDLERSLPRYMVPQAYVIVEIFPLTNNGKIDKNALPKWVGFDTVDFVAPRSEDETKLQLVWQKVLNHPEVGVKSDFFHLGGHSLLVQRLVHEINTEFGVMLGIRDVFENPTIEALVEIINDKKLIDTVVDENQMDSQETLEEMEW